MTGHDRVVVAVTVEHPARPPRAHRRAQAEAQVEQPEDRAEVLARELVGDGGGVDRGHAVETDAERQHVTRERQSLSLGSLGTNGRAVLY